MIYEWKNLNDQVAARLILDEELGIEIWVDNDVHSKHSNEIEELQTLNLYPPLDETKIGGEKSLDNFWYIYKIGKSKKWEFAKQDIVATFDFWMKGKTGLK